MARANFPKTAVWAKTRRPKSDSSDVWEITLSRKILSISAAHLEALSAERARESVIPFAGEWEGSVETQKRIKITDG